MLYEVITLQLIINSMFIIKRRGVEDHENADTKNDVAGNGARPDRVDRIRGSDDGVGAWV